MAAISDIQLPPVPAPHSRFIEYVAAHPHTPMSELLEPYKQYDAEMRKLFAQHPDHPALQQSTVVPIFTGHEEDIKIRARKLEAESAQERGTYIMPLESVNRKVDGAPAIVQSLRDFKTNFSVFSESSLVDLDFSNLIVAGSAAVTSLMPVPEKHAESKRALREYYHQKIAPASDVDIFLYGLTEDQAVEKIKQIERNIRDALLVESTVVRTKHAITIVSQYPTRHVQIVLRIYKSISEILTGFDVDSSCVAWDGRQVYASPRALAAFMTQINTIDLTRRSPSYENRLSKYAKRGFEVFWPNLDRSKIDPTIFERSFGRTEGLARLLVLEKLPSSEARDTYLDKRRAERGRPPVNRYRTQKYLMPGNLKDDHEDEVAEWVDAEEVSDYHTFTIPYGPKFHAKKIEKLIFTKDLLLNAEWNQKDRKINLHRHPAFFGTVEDVIHDCCGFCPLPTTVEEEEAAEEESRVYISGDMTFIKDDPGRQAIGSFKPLTADLWTEMAYVSNTGMLCQAIVDGDAEYVLSWLEQEGNDVNSRDWSGRTPLHLAISTSTVEIVQHLIDHGARLVARLADGKTALHLAAMRGNVDMVIALLRKSEANEEEEEKKLTTRRAKRKNKAAEGEDEEGEGLEGHKAKRNATNKGISSQDEDMQDDSKTASIASGDISDEGSDVDMIDNDELDDDQDMDATTEQSMINIKPHGQGPDDNAPSLEDDENEPDVYDVNVLAWDTAVSPLHLAIINGHVNTVKCLVQDFGADLLLPIKLYNDFDRSARASILTLVLALRLPETKAAEMALTLIQLGATIAQADVDQVTVLQYCIADFPDQLAMISEADEIGAKRSRNHLSVSGYKWSPAITGPLLTAIESRDTLSALRLLSDGTKPQITFTDWTKAYRSRHELPNDSKQNQNNFEQSLEQPIIMAAQCELPLLAKTLVESHNVDINSLTIDGHKISQSDAQYMWAYRKGQSLLDVVREKLEQMRKWKPDDQAPKTPKALEDDSDYLSEYEDRPYALWSAQMQLESAKERYAESMRVYQGRVTRSDDETGATGKRAAIEALIKEFEQLEVTLLEKQAKTFVELYPDVPTPDRSSNPFHRNSPEPKPFAIEFNFRLPDLSAEIHERYMKLFEAAWGGDLGTIKELTLRPWKDSSNEDQPPCQVAVQDQHELSPFAISVMHGRLEVASVIMAIAQAQYVPGKASEAEGDDGDEDEDVEDDEDDDEDDDDDDEEVRRQARNVDDQFTFEMVGEVSLQAKSRVSPLAMLTWDCPTKITSGVRTSHASTNEELSDPSNLIQLALSRHDRDLLLYLFSIGHEYQQKQTTDADEIEQKSFFATSERDFLYALGTNAPELLEEVIKVTGGGMPLNAFAKSSGREVRPKPKYYQGLSVHGKKRADWAAAGRGRSNAESVENFHPPLLEAIRHSSLRIVEWLLSDAPTRCYREFARAHRSDPRLRPLLEGDGFETSVANFLSTRSHLAIHCCLMSIDTSKDDSMLRYLITAFPETLDSKSADGRSPLHLAFGLYDAEAVKILTAAGANQTARDAEGNNIVHSLLSMVADSNMKLAKLADMLDLVDKSILPSLFLERSAAHPGSLTPVAQWINNTQSGDWKRDVSILRVLLQYSEGNDLGLVNGEGDTPLHVCVRKSLPELAAVILAHDPPLLNRENATGRTPFEMAEDTAIATACSDPPPLPGSYNFTHHRAKRFGLPLEWCQDVVERPQHSFVAGTSADRRNDQEKIWDLVHVVKHRLIADGHIERRLVTLNEANEVARRLAAKETEDAVEAHAPGYDEERHNKEMDEVQAWFDEARARVMQQHCDPTYQLEQNTHNLLMALDKGLVTAR